MELKPNLSVESAKERTIKIQKELKESINQIGKKPYRYLLENYFCLEPNESRQFVELIEDMNYFEPGYDTIPEPWFFEGIGLIKNKEGNILEKIGNHYFEQIFEERELIRQKIIRFRKLPGDLQEIAIREWPKEYHQKLRKEIKGGTGPVDIAYEILSKRWGISENDIEGNIKTYRKSKRARRSQ